MEIELIISDFDGTLVDTQMANFLSYNEILKDYNIQLTEAMYNNYWGLRLPEFLSNLGLEDVNIVKQIRESKRIIYPKYFQNIKLNQVIVDFAKHFKKNGKKVALASTAQRHNIDNVLDYFKISDLFDWIVSGENLTKSKPDPECYNQVMDYFEMTPEQTLIFEDSEVGIQAAKLSKANYILINQSYYGN
jgi:beta-phosphoglucomutase